MKLAEISGVARKALLWDVQNADWAGIQPRYIWNNIRNFQSTNPRPNIMDFRHSMRATMLYCDGHVGTTDSGKAFTLRNQFYATLDAD